MEVEISDSALLNELAVTLRRYGYSVVRTHRNRLHVGLGAEQRGAVKVLGSAELELDLYLRAWQARHPEVHVVRLDGPSRAVGG
jgi:hypothetical protein